ncbi:MAG: hypothetical protein HY785_15630 [Oscillatoriophycideae cyanobacterium NC_groundwater_1537_Pr4_S-0.65um_50_18]|nr:hypothetical protein [Oscillatoriophycideae cyanobacterium NC_groundwater_1537_Pr4_S-0.65um_50_18]
MTFQPIGSEFSVNTTTANDQDRPAIAFGSSSRYAIAWQSESQNGNDSYICGRLYQFDGGGVGSEFKISQAGNDPTDPAIAIDGLGNAIVVWSSTAQNGSRNVYAQRLDAVGRQVGATLLASSSTAGDQTVPAVAMDKDGNFVVTWTSNGRPNASTKGKDNSGTGVYAQQFTANGRSVGREFRVNTTKDANQGNSVIAMNSMGDYVIAWESSGQDGSGKGIYAQIYRSNGRRIGSELQVANATAGSQDQPTVGIDATGNFVIAWRSSDSDGLGIYARRFGASGDPLGQEFQVNSTPSDSQTTPSIGMEPEGKFAITWASNGQGSGYDIYAQRYNPAGKRSGGEFRVNQIQNKAQTDPAIGMAANGDFVVGWVTNNQGRDTDISAQRYQVATPPPSGNIEGSEGDNYLRGTAGDDRMYGQGGDDNLKAYGGRDGLLGGNGNDTLYGGSGSDRIEGGADRDFLYGGNGMDTLSGDGGRDTLTGGNGSDVFVIGQASGEDVIRDFRDQVDRLGLSERLEFQNLTVRSLGADTSIGVGNDIIAILKGVSFTTITAADFVAV